MLELVLSKSGSVNLMAKVPHGGLRHSVGLFIDGYLSLTRMTPDSAKMLGLKIDQDGFLIIQRH